MDSTGSGSIIAFGSTLTNGIQDTSALLPLLGTEQCEDHVVSALTGGFLHAAATPMSLFGSLGMARGGFKTFVSGISIPSWNIAGVQQLRNAGFEPKGTNLPLIMIDPDRTDRYLAESRLQSLMKELHIKESDNPTVIIRTMEWNLRMILYTATLCTLSLTPYIYLNIGIDGLRNSVRWVFPVTRALGGFLIATMTQLVIQERLSTIIRGRIFLNGLNLGQHQLLKEIKWKETDLIDRRLFQLESRIKAQILRKGERKTDNAVRFSSISTSNETDYTNVELCKKIVSFISESKDI
jgi:hypothetical protein